MNVPMNRLSFFVSFGFKNVLQGILSRVLKFYILILKTKKKIIIYETAEENLVKLYNIFKGTF